MQTAANAAQARRLTGRARGLILAAVFALALAFGLGATAAAEPADARVTDQCKHYTTVHRGEHRMHGMTFNRHCQYHGWHWHSMTHWHKSGGEWWVTWTDDFACYPLRG